MRLRSKLLEIDGTDKWETQDIPGVNMLHESLNSNREELISRCKAKVANRPALNETLGELDHGISVFLHQLTEVLRERSSGASEPEQEGTANKIVHAYGAICRAVTELAIERDARITNGELRIFNRCLDEATADAVAEYAHARDRIITDAHERTMNECIGFLAHEFRNLTHTSMLAFEALRRGDSEIAGSAGSILDRSLKGMQDLCGRALFDVRLRAGIPERRKRVQVSEFVEEAHVSATPEAKARGVELVVPGVDPGLAVDIDREILAGALANLLQNAFKFTRPRSRVLLKAFPWTNRVLIEVEDECGGLPGEPEDLFHMFEQRSSDRSGIGLGLGISRRGVELNGGTLHVRNLLKRGCVFTIDLPMPTRAM
jgi:signal transduction histidine kinase